MVGRVANSSSSRDSSFFCLLAIYAVHVLLFHVLDVTPFASRARFNLLAASNSSIKRSDGNSSHTAFDDVLEKSTLLPPDNDVFGELLNSHQMFARSSSLEWEKSITHHINVYRKIDFERLFMIHFSRVKNVFTKVALNSSTWGIIGGCAIFLLT